MPTQEKAYLFVVSEFDKLHFQKTLENDLRKSLSANSTYTHL